MKDLKKMIEASPINLAHLINLDNWVRLGWIILFSLASGLIVRPLTSLIAAGQCLMVLFTGSPNSHLLGFSESLATYTQHLVAYQCYNTDQKPFPFSPWPE